jgi:hypothetical protein
MNVLKTEEYTRSLPNGRWLRNMLEYEKEGLDGMMDKKMAESRQSWG